MGIDEDALTAALPGLLRYATWLTRDPADAEDLVQDTVLRALERGEGFRFRGLRPLQIVGSHHRARRQPAEALGLAGGGVGCDPRRFLSRLGLGEGGGELGGVETNEHVGHHRLLPAEEMGAAGDVEHQAVMVEGDERCVAFGPVGDGGEQIGVGGLIRVASRFSSRSRTWARTTPASVLRSVMAMAARPKR